ncbi:hypothetical protein WN979_14455 [Streptomyces albidoflavus]|uniref:hypothetical protein n=1 Tax=Streptomyces albidoflavus TaxID=1886 RepID=UPI003244385E
MSTEDAPQPVDQTDAPGDALGDAGKRALQALRQEVKDLRAELKTYQASEPAPDAARDAGEEGNSTSESTRDAAPTSDDTAGATPAEDVQPTRPTFQGTADGGARGTPPGPRQLSAADLRSMTPRQIEEARRAGRLRDCLSGNTR